MHPRATVAEVLRLSKTGLNNCEISRRTGVSRPTIRDWVRGRLPYSYTGHDLGQRKSCGGNDHRLDQLTADYAYLLNRVGKQLRSCNCYEVHAYSKGWPCLFPQHGPGMKHTRRIFLADWQQELAKRWPEMLLKGLIQSDGCRVTNTGRGGWRSPRYAFANVSTDITSIFCSACDCLGLHWTASFPTNASAAVSIYVSRKADVAKLDEFVGPKR
jgi:Homeodomain-like domain